VVGLKKIFEAARDILTFVVQWFPYGGQEIPLHSPSRPRRRWREGGAALRLHDSERKLRVISSKHAHAVGKSTNLPSARVVTVPCVMIGGGDVSPEFASVPLIRHGLGLCLLSIVSNFQGPEIMGLRGSKHEGN
jgi:hypothetical protein